MRGQLFLGTSGFAYQEWKGIFYPEGLSSAKMLPFYAERFNSVEINHTFRKFPEERTIRRWASMVEDGFRFALKANQRITHFKRLEAVDAEMKEFSDLARLLGDRLGPVLVQCPPTLPYDARLLDGFLGCLPGELRFAMEFRDRSWTAAAPALAERGVAWCVAETDEQAVDRSALPAGNFVYLRLRKERYDDGELTAWARTIASTLEASRDVFCYFKHEDKAAGPRFAARLSELLNEPTVGS